MKDKELKPNANSVGVAPLGDPHFEENTPVSSKTCSNPNSKPQTLTSNVAITLIALVITIIVMLILVGVTVSIAINGGLFSTAKRAVNKTEEAEDSELRFMAMANAATHNEKWEYTSKDNKTIPIPAGFAPTEIEGETSTEEGVVIIDAEGNEFVWIPCTKTEYEGATIDDSWPSWGYTDKTWTDSQTQIGETSIEKNGGFYVARYEAGVPSNAPFYASKDGDTYYYANGADINAKTNDGNGKNTKDYKPVSKKENQVWNCISQLNAKKVSEKMYESNTTVKSYLIDSHAWNLICTKFIRDRVKKDITNSINWGNYYKNTTTKYENLNVLYAVHTNDKKYAETYSKGIIPEGTAPKNQGSNYLELCTGASEDFKAYNIYDMAGNMAEWTTEIGDDTNTDSVAYASVRGGQLTANAWYRYSAVICSEGDFGDLFCGVGQGFRVVLYF